MLRYFMLTLAIIASTTLGWAQQTDSGDKPFDVRSSVGDLHVGNDADAGKAGMPLYPGARPKVEKDNDNDPLNFGVLTEAFGLKLIVAKYETADAPAKVIAFYRSKLKKYGKVLECHSQHYDAGVTVNDGDKDSGDRRELKCDENSGPVTELKVGTEDNQRIVAVEAGDASKGANFAIVYMHSRGKRGDI